MITGRGKEKFLKKEWIEKRRKILKNRYDYTQAEQEEHDVYFPDGGGRTDPEQTYYYKPINITDGKQKSKKKDIRDCKRYGY